MNAARDTYLDHASAEPLHPAAREMLERALDRGYADPRRLDHTARGARLPGLVESLPTHSGVLR